MTSFQKAVVAKTRLPSIREFALQIRGLRIGKRTVGNSADYLVTNRELLKTFGSIETVAFVADPENSGLGVNPKAAKQAKGLIHHLSVVRNSLRAELSSRQIFIDGEVIDELVYWVAVDTSTSDPIRAALEWIRDNRAGRPGLLVFPLHSLGVLWAGLLRPTHDRIQFLSPESGYALSPQTNSMKRTMEFLEDARMAFGVQKPLPVELLDHWRKSRPTRWLERNPLLVVRTIHLAGSYYGNEWFLISRVRATAAALSMLAALQPRNEARAAKLFSTRQVNNFQTLDIHHYITLFDSPGRRNGLEGYCVPIHARRAAVAELCNLDIEIDPDYWARSSETATKVHEAVEQVYRECLYEWTHPTKRPTVRTRTVWKLFESLSFFRRSSSLSTGDWTAKVSLSTAFEMLLTDEYGGITRALRDRTKLLLRGIPGTLAMQAAVGDVYEARCLVVHKGNTGAEPDMELARKAFVLCFLEVVSRLPLLSPTSTTPIGDLVGMSSRGK